MEFIHFGNQIARTGKGTGGIQSGLAIDFCKSLVDRKDASVGKDTKPPQ